MSEIRVDTISEKTSANGVAIDGLAIKDGKITNLMSATLSAADLGAGIHIKTADSGASVDTNGDELVIEGSGNAGINILTGTSANGRIAFGDSGDANIGNIVYDHSTNKLKFTAAADENFMYNGTIVGMGATGASADLGAGLHIRTADSGASVNANRDELVIEGSGNSGMTILSGTSSVGGIGFGDSGGNLQGLMQYNHATDDFEFNTNSSSNPLILHSGGQVSTNAETDSNVDAGGLCLNHGANDSAVLTLKNSDVAHPYTSLAQADTYARFSKNSAAGGGLFVQGYSDSSETAIQFRACCTDGDQTKSGAATGYFSIEATKTNGATSVGSPGSNENLVTIRSSTDDCVFIFDEEGTLHSDTSNTTFDEYEDAQLVRAYDLSHGRGVISSKFDKFVGYNHEKLAELKLVGRDADGSPNNMVNWMGISQLHNGAIWQQYEKHQKLANAMYELAKAAVGEDKANEILEQNDITLLN